MTKATSEDFLVTIPKNDILEASPKPEESPLVLLQLPPNCSPDQLQHFLADETRASLITDTASYSVQTLGTSNSLILLPPAQQCLKDETENPPVAKRTKSCRTARLLHKGNGASYLELRPRSAVALDQWKTLAKKNGPKIVPADWARRLQVAPSQVVQWLTASPPAAVPLEVYENCGSATTDDNFPTYTILDPEDAIVCQEAIVATLTECYGGTFESQPLDATTFVQQAAERVAGDAPKSMYPRDMMLHCARRLCSNEETDAAGVLRFDLRKVRLQQLVL